MLILTFKRRPGTSHEVWNGILSGLIHENILTVNASVHPVFGPHICPSPSRPNARWASGPRSPLAPTVPFSGTSDTQPAKQKQNFIFTWWEFFCHYNFGSLIGFRLLPAGIYLLKVSIEILEQCVNYVQS